MEKLPEPKQDNPPAQRLSAILPFLGDGWCSPLADGTYTRCWESHITTEYWLWLALYRQRGTFIIPTPGKIARWEF